jgi:AmmeMemoRadiSam system protein B
MQIVRPPAVAGAFYPADPGELRDSVDALLDGATRARTSDPAIGPRAAEVVRDVIARASHGPPKAIVVPHAGYVYSGPVAASAYASLARAGAARDRITRVVLVGPCHRVPVEGIAVPEADALDTPLGRVFVDAAAMELLSHFPEVTRNGRAHAREHSLEVQLPFLQRVLGAFAVVPLAVGGAPAATVARVLDALWGGPETPIVVSSDLSHYLPYAIGKGVDRYTAQRVLELSPVLDPSEACGATPLNALLIVARQRHLVPTLLDLRSSGDTAGPRDGVVGYGAFGFFEEEAARKGGEHHERSA